MEFLRSVIATINCYLASRNQRLVTWLKPVQQPAGSTMPEKEWQELPEEMTIRLIRYSYKDRTGRNT